MEKSSRENMFYSSTNLLDIVIDEVALEGLDGITLEALWQRLSLRLQITRALSQSLKEQIWTICVSVRDFMFYELNEPRRQLVIYDRYEYVDPDLGIILEPDDIPDDIYEYNPIDDNKNGIRGSCKDYYTRKPIESIRISSLKSAEDNYNSKLIIVASQSVRQYALIGDFTCPTLELNVTQYCFLERVGRSRYHGEVTLGKRSLSMLKEDPKTLFYHRKLLLKHKLITKQMYYQKNLGHGTSGCLLHLSRFYVERKPKMIYLAEKIIDILKSRDNNLADYGEIKKELGVESSIKHLFKTAFFQRVVKTDLIVPYRTLYPNAKSSEWQRKNCHLREKKIRVVQLTDPSIDINDLWIKDDGFDDDESSYELDTSNQIIHKPYLQQANLIVEQANYNGLSQNELSIKMGVTKLQARTFFRNLSKVELVATYMNDMGRQRLTKYVSKKFEKNSNISKQYQIEMEKMKEFTKKSNIENESKKLSSIATNDDIKSDIISNNNVTTPIRQLIHNDKLQENNKILFSIVNRIKKKYKLNKYGFKYGVIKKNIGKIKDLSLRCAKSMNNIRNRHNENVNNNILSNNISIDDELSKTECNVELEVTELLNNLIGDIRYSIKDMRLSDPKNTSTITYRILRRANMIIEAVKEHKIIDDMTKLMKMINEEEEREGYDVKIDKKSLIRLLQKLASDKLVKNIKLTLRSNDMKKIIIFICDPCIDINHTVIQSAVEQAKIKFCLTASSNKYKSSSSPTLLSSPPPPPPPPLPLPPSSSLQLNDDKISMTSKRAVKSWTDENSKIIPRNLILNGKAGKNYGYSPKFIRMKIIHQLLYHLIYDHPGHLNISRDKQIEQLRERGNELDDRTIKEMSELFSIEIGWKMFIPPLTLHNGWPQGWVLFCDVLLRIPLSIFLKVYNVPFIIPDLDYYIKNPIRQHYLIKDLPSQLRNILLMKRRYIFSIHETITRLCFIGLVQFGPQKLKEKDQVFIYLNRKSQLMDTTTSAASYHKIQVKNYPIVHYLFDKMQDVEKYWYDMWHICVNTQLGGRSAVLGTDIILEELTKKIDMIKTLKPIAADDAESLDLGVMPGDKRGAAGIDSAFFSHLKRNWNWENLNSSYSMPINNSDIRYHNIQRKTQLSKIQNKPIKYTEFTGLKKITGPTSSVHINNLRDVKKSQQKITNAVDKLMRLKILTNKCGRKQNAIVRRVLPRKRKTRCRVKYDDIDYSALQKMDKLRVDWDPREDNILLVCKVVMMYLAPNPRSQVITFTAVRDVLRLYSLSSYNKTSRACQRRLLYMLKQPQTIHSVTLGVEELKQNYFVNKRYGNIVEKIRKTNDPNECDEKIAEIFKNLVAYVAKKYYDISQTQSNEMRYEPNTLQEFNLIYEINHPQKPHGNQGFTNNIKTINDIHTATINSVIYSSMGCGKDRKSWAYQLFRIYQQYPETLLRNAMGKIRSDQMVSMKRNYVSAMKKYGNCMPMSSSQYQLSTAYIYKFHTKLPTEIYHEIHDYFFHLINGYNNGKFNVIGGGIQIFPPTGGMIMAIQECLAHNKLNFNVEIPDHVITLLDPKLQEYDETYIRIAKRYQDILSSLEKLHTQRTEKSNQSIHHPEIIDKTNDNVDNDNDDVDDDDDEVDDENDDEDEDDDDDDDDDDNNDTELRKKRNYQRSKVKAKFAKICDKPSVNKRSVFKREHWGWGSIKSNCQNDDLNNGNDDNNFDCNESEYDNDYQCIKLQDGAIIAITKNDVECSLLTVVDNSIHEAFYKSHTHLANDFLDYNSIERLNNLVSNNNISTMDIDDNIKAVNNDELSSQNEIITNNKSSNDTNLMINNEKNSNFINDIINNMVCEVESSLSCCKKESNTDDVQKSCTRIALLKMREELNDDLPDSHHAHDYFVVSTFGIYYSLPEIDNECHNDANYSIDNDTINKILLLKDNNYNKVVGDLMKFSVFPKEFPDFIRIKMQLEEHDNIISPDIDSIFYYIRDKRERGATLKELKITFYNKYNVKLYDILDYLVNDRLLLRSGVTEMHYIHHNYIDPWIIQSIRIMRLQRDALPLFPPGSVYVLNSHDDDKNAVNNDIDNSTNDIKDDDNLLFKLNDNNSKNIRKNRRTCLLQTKDIYTAAKKLDLNTAEDINVVIRPWIQIDGVINRCMLEKMLSAVLAHCIMNPGIILSQVQSRFLPALQPYHTRELVEILVKLECLQLNVLSKATVNLFSKSSSTQLCIPAKFDGTSAYDDELIVEAVMGAILKYSAFLLRYQTKQKSTSTDTND